MCTVVILRRPGHDWPLLVAANRDELADRPWLPPARHWHDRADVVAGLDILGGGTWLGMNTHGVVAGVLNRLRTLGPSPGKRSRGELPLEALRHAGAPAAVAALAVLDPHAYRAFNLFVADSRDGFWIRCVHDGEGDGRPATGRIEVFTLPPGLSMITAYDRNDRTSPRIRRYLHRFETVAVPDPGGGDWRAWIELLANREFDADSGPGGAMTVITPTGFGTVCASLIAVPAQLTAQSRPKWLFAAGRPGECAFQPVLL